MLNGVAVWRQLRWTVAGLMLCGAVVAEPLTVTAGNSELVFDGQQPVPVRWTLCAPECALPGARKTVLYSQQSGGLELQGAAGTVGAPRVEQLEDAVIVRLSLTAGEVVYRIANDRPEVRLTLPPGVALNFASGDDFVPEQLPGFGQIYSRVRPVQVSSEGQQLFDEQLEDGDVETVAASDNWTGVRNRYWALLLQPAQERVTTLSTTALDRPLVSMPAASQTQELRLYAGPVEWRSLKSVAPELSEMLFAALWDFLRALTFGMMLLLELIYSIVGNYGLSIVLLSLSAKILMYPLTALADKWQRQVNEIHSLLKPEMDAIRREHKGEEAHNRVLAVYRKHDVSQFYTFKSAAGFLIQIPVFIAAFDMLAENFALNAVGFLWMADLAKPDQLLALPLVLPFLGGYLNLLPFLMTFLSSLAAWLQAEDTLSAELQRQQSLRLYLMSAAFFILFYTFPAGMVLYWTSSNLFHLLKVESGRLFVRE
jgi:YidC/Oxa1 family membrane protein insertase